MAAERASCILVIKAIQQFVLPVTIQALDILNEQRAAAGFLERGRNACGPLALDERLRGRQAQEGAPLPLAAIVDRTGQRPSAAPRFALDQNRQDRPGGAIRQPCDSLPLRTSIEACRIPAKRADVVCKEIGRGMKA